MPVWKVEDVCSWLKCEKMPPNVIEAFANAAITGQGIIDGITDEDLQEMGITIRVLRRSILTALRTLIAANGLIFFFSFKISFLIEVLYI